MRMIYVVEYGGLVLINKAYQIYGREKFKEFRSKSKAESFALAVDGVVTIAWKL